MSHRYLPEGPSADWFAAKGALLGEDTDVQDCLDCGALWDALRETHRCRVMPDGVGFLGVVA